MLNSTEMILELATLIPGVTGYCGCLCHTRAGPFKSGQHGRTCRGASCDVIAAPLLPESAAWNILIWLRDQNMSFQVEPYICYVTDGPCGTGRKWCSRTELPIPESVIEATWCWMKDKDN